MKRTVSIFMLSAICSAAFSQAKFRAVPLTFKKAEKPIFKDFELVTREANAAQPLVPAENEKGIVNSKRLALDKMGCIVPYTKNIAPMPVSAGNESNNMPNPFMPAR